MLDCVRTLSCDDAGLGISSSLIDFYKCGESFVVVRFFGFWVKLRDSVQKYFLYNSCVCLLCYVINIELYFYLKPIFSTEL